MMRSIGRIISFYACYRASGCRYWSHRQQFKMWKQVQIETFPNGKTKENVDAFQLKRK